MTTLNRLEDNFRYHEPNEQTKGLYPKLRGWGLDMSKLILRTVPECRERSLALTKIEEAIMWANAGISRNIKE